MRRLNFSEVEELAWKRVPRGHDALGLALAKNFAISATGKVVNIAFDSGTNSDQRTVNVTAVCRGCPRLLASVRVENQTSENIAERSLYSGLALNVLLFSAGDSRSCTTDVKSQIFCACILESFLSTAATRGPPSGIAYWRSRAATRPRV